jgi:ribonucleotide reductase alpha subunit
LANEVVIGFKAQRRSERLQEMLEEVTQTDPESAKIAMSLVEAIGKATTELNLCVSRQQKLLDDLTEKRSDKLSKQIKDNASVLNIFRAWKEEETRKEWLKLAEIEEKALDKEVEKITSMDEIKSKVLGLTKAEALYG